VENKADNVKIRFFNKDKILQVTIKKESGMGVQWWLGAVEGSIVTKVTKGHPSTSTRD